jgi:ubiquinol-cytochrome c reductase cytochrome b subunit
LDIEKFPSNTKKGDLLATSGLGLFLQFTAQIIVGIVLGLSYRADPAGAHGSVAQMAPFLRGFHYWGSAILIGHSFVHLTLAVWQGRYKPPFASRFLATVGMFLCAMAFQVTGNLLPFDRHGVQTAAIEGSIAARVPVVGPSVARAMMGGQGFNDGTLTLWYTVHRFVLPAVLIGMWLLALTALRRHRDVTARPVPAVATLLLPLILTLLVASPLGSPATTADYDTFDALPSWYTWPAHGSLVLFDRVIPGGGWIGTALLPGLFFLFLLGLPLLHRRIRPSVATGIFLAFLALFGVSGAGFGGGFAPLVGKRDPAGPVPPPQVAVEKKPQNAVLAARGATLFTENGCDGCHGKGGMKGDGGPSLARTHERHPDAEYFMRYIKNPKSVKAGSTMPAYESLKEEELRALAEYLRFPRK